MMQLRGLAAVVVALALLPIEAAGSLPVDPVTGDTIIDTSMTIWNETLKPDGNITILPGGSLTLTDCTLRMRSPKNIEVKEGGSLVLRNVTIDGIYGMFNYGFACWGRLEMSNCTVFNAETFDNGSVRFGGGINLFSSDCSITDSNIFVYWSGGVAVRGGAPVLRRNVFVPAPGSGGPAVLALDSRPVIEDNTFINHTYGDGAVEVHYPAAPLISNNTFSNCSTGILFYYIHQHGDTQGGGGGCESWNQTLIAGNTFRDCQYGIMTADDYFGHGQGRQGTEGESGQGAAGSGQQAADSGQRAEDCGQGAGGSGQGAAGPQATEGRCGKEDRGAMAQRSSGSGQGAAGSGQGEGGTSRRAAGGRAPGQEPLILVSGNIFVSSSIGLYSFGECPAEVEGCSFLDDGVGVRASSVSGLALAGNGFQNCTQGIRAQFSSLSAVNNIFDGGDYGVSSDNSVLVLDGNRFSGSNDTGARLVSNSEYSLVSLVANNTISGSDRMGLYIAGPSMVVNNTISGCPFGLYRSRAGNGGGVGHRDSSQGPPPQPEVALVSHNRFFDNTRGIYTEGKSNISSNAFSSNGAGVEVSSYIHPMDVAYDERYIYVGTVDDLTIEHNLFENNSEGVVFLATNEYDHFDDGSRRVRDNSFNGNGIGVDLLRSEAECRGNNFTGNGGWAFRLMGSWSETGDNVFGRCDRVWRESLLRIYIYDTLNPESDYYYYCPSDGAATEVRARSGRVLYRSPGSVSGMPEPDFSPDGFPFSCVNLTTGEEFGDGTVRSSGGFEVEARKAGVGAARAYVSDEDEYEVYLFLEPMRDLALTGFNFSDPAPREGERLDGYFTILNDNTYDPENVSLMDVPVEVLLDGEVFESFWIPWLQSGRPQTRAFSWTAVAGTHNWSVRADPRGELGEVREDNNLLDCQLRVNGAPQAALSVQRPTARALEKLAFDGFGSQDDGAVTAYLFDFGDGASSGWTDDPVVGHAYARMGTYGARLKVQDDSALESEWSAPVEVRISNLLPSLKVSTPAGPVFTVDSVNFSAEALDPEGSPLNLWWDFGDGSYLFGRDLFFPTHAYAQDGIFNVSVTVTDGDGGQAEQTLTVPVMDRPPRALFLASPSSGSTATRFTFISLSFDDDGRVVSHEWDFGDGHRSAGERPDHRYLRPGLFNVSLTVTDDDGSRSTPCTAALEVANSPPVSRARLCSSSPGVNQEVTFDGSASHDAEDPEPLFLWDFGDGQTATGPVVSHRYTAPGIFQARLRVTDHDGGSSETVLLVSVSGEVPGIREADRFWQGAAAVAGILAVLGVLLLIWLGASSFRRKGRERVPKRRVRKILRTVKATDVYALKLARNRANNHDLRGMRDSLPGPAHQLRNEKK